MAQSLPNKQLAAALRISEPTVKWHFASVMIKPGDDSRAQAAVMAVQRGLL